MSSIRAGNRRGQRRIKNEINVVPYIDVMLVLLVIFMVTAPLVTPGLINLPTVGQAESIPRKPFEVQIDEKGAFAVRDRDTGSATEQVAADQLTATVLARLQPEQPVVIAADGKVPYETVMKVMDDLRRSGVSQLGLLVDQKSEPAPGQRRP